MSVWYEEGKGFCIQKVITDNQAKIETYKINPQELVKDLRKSEIALDPSKVGGM